MDVVRWFKCPVIGTGRATEEKDNSYRPAIADLPILQEAGWSAVYYPSRPPYKFCVVRAVIERDIPASSKAGELDIRGIGKLCDKLPYFKHRWLDQPVYPATITKESIDLDPVETRYFRSDLWTVNGVYAHKLSTSRSGVGKYYEVPNSEAYPITSGEWFFRVDVRHEDTTTTNIADSIGKTYRSSDGQGIQSASWSCPETPLTGTDALYISMRTVLIHNTTRIVGNQTFITEQLGASKLNAANWTYYRYSYLSGVGTGSGSVRTYWDTSTYNTRITNFTWTEAGWTGKISGVTNPAKVMGVDKANIETVKGVA